MCCNGTRYRQCDTNFPGVLVMGFNSYGFKYRMVDGKHRMMKLVNAGIKESRFNIISKQEFLDKLILI